MSDPGRTPDKRVWPVIQVMSDPPPGCGVQSPAVLVRCWIVAATVAGCGRIGFEPAGTPTDATDSTGGTDGWDGSPACVAPACSGPSRAMMCGTRCFAVCDEEVTQPVAKARCTAWGGELVSIHSQAEQTCVDALIEAAGTWIGYEQGPSTEITANWMWSDGRPVDFAPQWFSNEPNDGDGTENGVEQCGDVFTNGAWNDDECTNSRSIGCAR